LHTAEWVTSWASGQSVADADGRSAAGFTDQTVRNVVHLSVGGSRLRVRLSNAFGVTALSVGAASVGIRAAAADLVQGSRRRLRFGGQSRLVLPPGAQVCSDPVPLPVDPQQDLAVSLYLTRPTGPVTWHPDATGTNCFSLAGDQTEAERGAAFTQTTGSWFFLSGVDVAGSGAAGTIVTLGSSTSDGAGSTGDANRRYPDVLARRLLELPAGRRLGVANVGIGGNRLLTDSGSAGVNAQARFGRDVCGQAGVRAVLVWVGMNDIGGGVGPYADEPVTAADLITGWRNIIANCRQHGFIAVGATLQPHEGADNHTERSEPVRQAVNQWIRTSGEFDGVADFDLALRDPARPARMLAEFDSGDHLHPSDAGYRAIAHCIDLDLF
jgi:lysophospholipase L1-like esterase